MKKHTLLTILFACGLLVTSTPVYAQTTNSSWFMGNVNLLLLGRDDVQSSKFEEYRTVPHGLSMSAFTLQGNQKGMDFALLGKKVGLTDQRYTGWLQNDWIGVAFDYNQIPHSMGNHGHSIENNTAPGVWQMSSTLRGALGNAVDAQLPTANRTYTFYNNLYAPTVAAANILDLDALRQRGNVEFDLGKKLPFNLTVAYTRDLKTGTRGSGGGVIYSAVNNIVELPEALDEVTQDIGFRAALNKNWGNLYGAYNHNWYNNLLETTVFDNPLRAFDQAYTASAGAVPALGGSGSGRLVGPPDNSADQGSFGVMLKFGKQTRLTADFAFGQWLQNAQLYPHTINSTILTTTGVRADSLAALDVQSLNGKINTAMMNFSFSSRPFAGFGLRARYRSYDMDNNTPGVMHTGTVGNAPDRSWAALSASAFTPETPYGFTTANPYGSKTGRFDVQGSYDIKDLTFEATYRNAQIDRTYREATKGEENGWSIAAILHTSDWFVFRGVYDDSTRTASGYDPTTSLGLQADESERDSTRAGFDFEISPNDKVMFLVAYFRRNDEFPNRPNRTVDGTPNGLLKAKYDTYTFEADLTPNDRFNFGVFYTYEKNLSTTQTGGTTTTGAGPLASLLTFDGSDRGDTWGVNGRFVLQPEKWAFGFNAQQSKIDGLMNVTGDPAGSFALARVAYGGIADITDYNDTDLTTAILQLDYTFAKALTVSVGYAYEKYVFADVYSIFGNVSDVGQFGDANENFPASGGFYLKANDGGYKVNIAFAKLVYRW